MPNPARQICQPSALLAAFAFAACWFMTGMFDDDFARLVLATAFASWVAVSSGITGFLLLQMEAKPRRKAG
jgi:hypothetical protein